MRKQKRIVNIGGVKIGGDNPVAIQSMCNTDTRDVKATVNQIHELENAGCEIIRVAVPDMVAAKAVADIKKQIHIPLVVDIHFDYRLALECMKNGADKVRINPGNIGDRDRVKQVVEMAKEREIPIRIGVNGGSLERELLQKYGGVTADALVEAGEEGIFALKTGFRAGYIYDAAVKVKTGEVVLDDIAKCGDYEKCTDMLCSIKGVGPKVSSCVLLFGFGKTEAFPIDVWMKRSLALHFPNGFDPKPLGKYAGIAQQYMFYHERWINSESTKK